jgi:hypothetical protein
MSEGNSALSFAQKAGISIAFGITLPLLVLELLLRLLPVIDGTHLLAVNERNPIPRFEPNRDFTWSKDWNFSIVSTKHSNNYGFLADTDYSKEAASPLLAVIGDSFVAAYQLENRRTVQGVLESWVGDRGRVYSFAVAGAPLSTYLAYAEYARLEFRPDAMVFVIVGNDFDESLPEYKRSDGYHRFFTTESGSLELRRIDYAPSFMKRLARSSALVRYVLLNLEIRERIVRAGMGETRLVGSIPADAGEKRVSDSRAVVGEFFDQLPARTGLSTADILFVIDGVRPEIYTDSGRLEIGGSYIELMRSYFIEAARGKGYEVIDMHPVFAESYERDGLRFDFETDPHWNELGHRLVAGEIARSSLFTRIFGARLTR